MKKYLFISLIFLLAGCKEENIGQYDPQESMIEFRSGRSEFSFRFSDGLPEQVVEIPLNIVGYPAAVERRATFAIVADSTTAAAGQYEIMDAIVPAESFTGTLRVKVINDRGADFEDVRVYLRAVSGDDFGTGPVQYRDHALYLTNKLVRPSKWTETGFISTQLLGRYSTAYYAFIIETTGETNFPILSAEPGYNNGQVWTVGYTSSLINNIKEALREYNRTHETPLTHDDGAAAGYPVVVGKYDYP